ncbi:hypothetical protein IMZ08_18600 [Bacillus luteolus]|uniref:Uncharacterized protein n=1 Tax=Litchfieldia luteola TaxID=682179 RepID=A0ABR9QNH7_9BACI|nr:hypothetical protein [Cytobacillus luteolus]MBE4910052.1 hypothetical protein [Cytobacillus luteolus]MBP1942387.1 hypothetical protein [Cytobacillus luteolus]
MRTGIVSGRTEATAMVLTGRIIKYVRSLGDITNYIILQIFNVMIEIDKDIFENAIIIDTGETRFFFLKSEAPTLLPINVKGSSESGDFIFYTKRLDVEVTGSFQVVDKRRGNG